jgi:hypothetical protein
MVDTGERKSALAKCANALATIARCGEEKAMLQREARVGVEFCQHNVRRLESALEGIPLGPSTEGLRLLLLPQLHDARRLLQGMNGASEHLQSLFSTTSSCDAGADSSTGATQGEHDRAIGADADLPEMSDDEYTDDELDEGMDSDAEDLVEGIWEDEEEVDVRW